MSGTMKGLSFVVEVVGLEEFFDVGEFVVDFGADLGEGDAFFVAPCLGGSLGDLHELDELAIVDKGLGGGDLFKGLLHSVDSVEELLKLVFGNDDCFHFLLC